MNDQIAILVFAIIMGIGFGVWGVSLWLALGFGKLDINGDSTEFQEKMELPFAEGPSADESGSVVLTGSPEELSKALVQSLKQSFMGQIASIYQIRRHPDCRVVLKKTGPLICNLPQYLYFTDADISFNPTNGTSVEVKYRLAFGRLVRRLRTIALGIILGIGLPVLLIVGSVIWIFVIPNPQPAIRWQVFQAFQVVHALWPPYMIMGFYWKGRTSSKTWLENLIESLET